MKRQLVGISLPDNVWEWDTAKCSISRDLQKYAFSICSENLFFPTGDHRESQLVSSWPAVPSGPDIRSSWPWGGLPSAAPPYSCHPTPAAGGRWWCYCQCPGPTGVYSVPSPESAPFHFYGDQPKRNEVTCIHCIRSLIYLTVFIKIKILFITALLELLFWMGSYLVMLPVYFQLWAGGTRQCQELNEPGLSLILESDFLKD